MKLVFLTSIFFLLLNPIIGHSQGQLIDSLIAAYNSTSKPDEQFDLAFKISHACVNVDNEKAIFFSDQAMVHARDLNDPLKITAAYESKGNIYTSNGETKKALTVYLQTLQIYEQLADQREIAKSANNLANIYLAIDDYINCKKYFKRSYDAAILSADSNAIAVPLVGLSILYEEEGKVQEALDAISEAILLFEGINRKDAMVVCYVNAATYCHTLGRIEDARTWMEKGKAINTELQNKYFGGSILINEAKWLEEEGKYEEARISAEEGVRQLNTVNAQRDAMQGYKTLSEIYFGQNNYSKAYDHLLTHLTLKDSLDQENKTEIIEEMSAKYETAANQQKIADLEHSSEIQNLENKKNQTITYFAIGGSFVMLILVILAFIAYRQKKKSATALAEKNDIIEEKNREILDSIQYAKRIQNAIIPSNELINLHLKESFVFYKPKDIVAGDFYWMESIGDILLFAVADCTGHGVPGAMVSVVCNNALNRAVREFKLTTPSKILDKTRELVIETFAQSSENVKDGMDITMCSWNKKTNEIQWAGANNPLYVIPKESSEIKILPPDKQPIGVYHKTINYTHHSIQLQPGDTMYLFSDGFTDQFGGLNGKKYKFSQFRNFLLSHFKEKMKEQERLLEQEFLGWKGDFEQLDDICIVGIRIPQ